MYLPPLGSWIGAGRFWPLHPACPRLVVGGRTGLREGNLGELGPKITGRGGEQEVKCAQFRAPLHDMVGRR